MNRILVTGGAGYIGTHVMVALGQAGYHCVCVDNYSNSSPKAIEHASALAPGKIEAHEADIVNGTRILIHRWPELEIQI